MALDKVTNAVLADNAVAETQIATGAVTQPKVSTAIAKTHDLSLLGLRMAINENSTAFNLPNSFIDQFEDNDKIGSEAGGTRSVDEFWCPIVSAGTVDGAWGDVWLLANESSGSTTQGHQTAGGVSGSATQQAASFSSGVTFTKEAKKWGAKGIDFSSSRANNMALSLTATLPGGGFRTTSRQWTVELWLKQTIRNSANLVPLYSDTCIWAVSDTYASINIGAGGRIRYYQYTGSAVYNDFNTSYTLPFDEWVYLVFSWTNEPNVHMWADGNYVGGVARQTLHSSTPATCRFGISQSNVEQARFIGYMDDIRVTESRRYGITGLSTNVPTGPFYPRGKTSNSATGTLIGTAIVPSSAKTKVSGVILYKNNAGTATIGTDLKIYFTCNGGTNWTEAASYTAITPDFSTGIKQVKLGETTCTSGSDIRYKAVWANQSSGSKETQLHGIGFNY